MQKKSGERKAREERLRKLNDLGTDAYPARVTRSHTCEQFLSTHDQLQKHQGSVTLVGRIRSIRKHGGSTFVNLEDGTANAQLFVKRDEIGTENYSLFFDTVDIGDFIEATGLAYTTQRGEKSLVVKSSRIISKALEPLPEKWHGLTDVELRYRKRQLDLIANPEVRAIFTKRAILLRTLRTFLEDQHFIEVETPILQAIPGGALARPFRTHHNALGTDFFLRVAPELYLKRLIVGGFERVYEIARCFRNEGIDYSHNPEFTQVEFYVAYMDYLELMTFFERLVAAIAHTVTGGHTVEHTSGTIDFTPPFVRMTFRDAMLEYGKLHIDDYPDTDALAKELKQRSVEVSSGMTRAKLLDEALKTLVRPQLIRPTFIYEYPIELSPLAKKTQKDERYVERFQFFCGGMELANAFSEINDPLDQDDRFRAQQREKDTGDDETHEYDGDFIEALSYGMPPTAGLGMGIDRMTNLLTNTHGIKEVILFPTLKPKR